MSAQALMTASETATRYSFDVALNPGGIAPDGRFIPMLSGYAELLDDIWQPTQTDHSATQFESLRIAGGTPMELRLFSDYYPDGGLLGGVEMTCCPSIESVAAGHPTSLPSPWANEQARSYLAWSDAGPASSDAYSAGIERDYQYCWVLDCGPVIASQIPVTFLLRVVATATFDGQRRDFAIDPELIIEGGS